MAAGDVTIHGSSGMGVMGLRFVFGTVQLDGENPTRVSLTGKLRQVLGGIVSGFSADAPGLDMAEVTCEPDGAALDALSVSAWKPTASGDATLIASTNSSALVSFFAWGLP